jgi:CHAD domain-containing protein
MRPSTERALKKLSDQVEVLRSDRAAAEQGDVEAVHRMRVAARKLRTWLALMGRGKKVKKARQALRGLKDGLGVLRDLQVHGQATALEKEGALALARRAIDAFDRRAKKVTKVMAWPKPRRPRGTRKQLRRLGEQAGRALERLGPALEAKRTHRARILLRKVRHGLQLVERGDSVAEPLEALQDLLGQLHDLDVLLEEKPGPGPARQRKAKAVEAWGAVQKWIEERRTAELLAGLGQRASP